MSPPTAKSLECLTGLLDAYGDLTDLKKEAQRAV